MGEMNGQAAETCGDILSLSAQTGEREGTRRDSDGEGEVFRRRAIAPVIGTHLSQPSPPASGRRGLNALTAWRRIA